MVDDILKEKYPDDDYTRKRTYDELKSSGVIEKIYDPELLKDRKSLAVKLEPYLYGSGDQSEIRNSTAQNSTFPSIADVTISSVQNSTALNSTASNSTVQNSVLQNSTTINSTLHNSTGQNSTSQNSTEDNSNSQNSTSLSETEETSPQNIHEIIIENETKKGFDIGSIFTLPFFIGIALGFVIGLPIGVGFVLYLKRGKTYNYAINKPLPLPQT